MCYMCFDTLQCDVIVCIYFLISRLKQVRESERDFPLLMCHSEDLYRMENGTVSVDLNRCSTRIASYGMIFITFLLTVV